MRDISQRTDEFQTDSVQGPAFRQPTAIECRFEHSGPAGYHGGNEPRPGMYRLVKDRSMGFDDVAHKRRVQFSGESQISNPVILTGNIRNNCVNDLKINFDQEHDEIAATEFVGTSISSGGNGSERRPDISGVLRDNPFVKFFNGEEVVCTAQ